MWHLKIIDWQSEVNNWFNASINFIEILMLCYAYRAITTNMKSYHLFRYHEIQKNLRFFFIISLLDLSLNFLINGLINVISNPKNRGADSLFANIGFYQVLCGYIQPIVLGFSFIFLKDSKDPL